LFLYDYDFSFFLDNLDLFDTSLLEVTPPHLDLIAMEGVCLNAQRLLEIVYRSINQFLWLDTLSSAGI
jgi:hypothetical protein